MRKVKNNRKSSNSDNDNVGITINNPEKVNMLTSIETILRVVEDSKLLPEYIEAIEEFLRYISEHQGITPAQALLLSLFVEGSSDGSSVTLSTLARYLACDRTPILLFNEADAILGTRIGQALRAVDKMENAIQNIILQEMETLDGIMIATTNLEHSLDSAFERRFIYKVRFDRPDIEQRQKIWLSMLPALSEDLALQLATSYDFSGGQIENIVRKCDVETILYGEVSVDAEKIQRFCQEETIRKNSTSRIGFI